MDELITYMGHQWIQVDGDILTIGINDVGLEEFTEIQTVNLPEENADLSLDEVCGELETDQGPMNIYCPVDGKVTEINDAIVSSPTLIQEDPYGDGWLFRIEASSTDQVDALSVDSADDGDDRGEKEELEE